MSDDRTAKVSNNNIYFLYIYTFAIRVNRIHLCSFLICLPNEKSQNE